MLHCFHFLPWLAEGRSIQSHAEKNKIVAERYSESYNTYRHGCVRNAPNSTVQYSTVQVHT